LIVGNGVCALISKNAYMGFDLVEVYMSGGATNEAWGIEGVSLFGGGKAVGGNVSVAMGNGGSYGR
jgi:hypothetical protein